MPIDKTKITIDMVDKAKQCKTADDLIALAKSEGFELTVEEAEAYLAELENIELDMKDLDKVAGGDQIFCYSRICPRLRCPQFSIS